MKKTEGNWFSSAQLGNVVFVHSYIQWPSRAKLCGNRMSSVLDGNSWVTVADRGWKPVPDDWSIDSKLLQPDVLGFLHGTTMTLQAAEQR